MPPFVWPPATKGPSRGRRALAYGGLFLLCLAGGLLAGWLINNSSSSAPAGHSRGLSVATLPPGTSLVADARRARVAVFASPSDPQPKGHLSSPNQDGAPVSFLVKGTRRGWYEVYLPSRPNGSVGWIHASAVSLALDPYRVRVDLKQHHITVWKRTKAIMRAPVGVGEAASPTPPGLYYITELLKQPDPYGLYGPYAFGLSVHTQIALIRSEFPASDGRIGLHGTDDPAGLGTNVSHGCIRLSNANITKLAHLLPGGTPVQITG